MIPFNEPNLLFSLFQNLEKLESEMNEIQKIYKNCVVLNCNVIEYNKNIYLSKSKIFNTMYKKYLELLVKTESK